jgi:hypothetical protein
LAIAEIPEIQNTGVEWLLHAINGLPERERAMLLMVVYIEMLVGHIRNEMVHDKIPSTVKVSCTPSVS